MKSRLRILAVAIVAATSISLIGCAGPAGYSYQNVTVTLTPMCFDCPNGIIYNPAFPVPSVVTPTTAPGAPGAPSPVGSVLLEPNAGPGGSFLFQADVTNAPPNLTWTIFPTPDLGDIQTLPASGSAAGNNVYSYGSFVSVSGNDAYFAQTGIPTYTGGPALQQAIAMGIPQGDVLIQASVPSNPDNPSAVATANQLIQMFNPVGSPTLRMFPSSSTSITPVPSVASVPRGTSFQFTGYAVGDPPCTSVAGCNAIFQGAPLNTTDNAVVWLVGNSNGTLGGIANATVGGLVNGVPGPYGTITQTGLYTAPPLLPVSGFSPVVYLESHAVPALTPIQAYITVQ